MIELYLQLFITFFKIGVVGFGGGYAMLSMVQYEVVERHAWLTVAEFTDIVALSQMSPGPIAINSATYIGYMSTGGSLLGAVIATTAVCLPSVIIMVVLSRFFFSFNKNRYVIAALSWMKPAAIGLIAAAALLLINPQTFIDYRSVMVALIIFVLAYFFKMGTIRLIVLSGVLGFLLF